MMQIKTIELKGAVLDWAVTKAEGLSHDFEGPKSIWGCHGWATSWEMGGPIIEREGIEITQGNPLYFPQGNEKGEHYEPLWTAGKYHGQTPLIAAMRCYVGAVLGEAVDVPEAVLND